ncbi:hypothetical protein LV457_05030 [Mycobacterium sp. MYCO198283]|uniref:hypothetical protein n=1 Tax=Mycobacterium sp. MYCO198283 TaxID=2883505 RepID=UPI001E59C6CB|nr:hypothetical protein [Mycobacterium sp. MYCO198283]MCG5431655.1 hypothetical protein [Mycobacterium sp. MYCO198283]
MTVIVATVLGALAGASIHLLSLRRPSADGPGVVLGAVACAAVGVLAGSGAWSVDWLYVGAVAGFGAATPMTFARWFRRPSVRTLGDAARLSCRAAAAVACRVWCGAAFALTAFVATTAIRLLVV